MNVHLITIGTELLIGQVVDSNSAFIGKELTKYGFNVVEISSISDDSEIIKDTLKRASENADIIITTGGLGPTKDDITKQTIAEYLGVELELNEEVLNHIQYIFQEVLGRKGELNRMNVLQAHLPKGSIVLKNPIGTAPGMWSEKNGKVFINLPGVPMEMKKLVTEQVLPRLRSQFETPIILQRNLLVVGIPESELAIRLENWENEITANDIDFAYLPNGSRVRVRLTAKGNNENELSSKLNQAIQELTKLIGDNIQSIKGESIEVLLAKHLTENNLTIATAESCTGGTIAKLLTSISGSSAYYKGSFVVYQTELKQSILGVNPKTVEENTVVSKEVAIEMARGIKQKFNTNIAIATTGVAGPNKGEDGKDIGLVWVAIIVNDQIYTRKIFRPQMERNDWIDYVSKKVLEILYSKFYTN